MIDTHAHIDGEEFALDRLEMLQRAQAEGIETIFIPAIDLPSSQAALDLHRKMPHYLYPMIGLHPEEVKSNYSEVLKQLKKLLLAESAFIAIGEVGLDFYWSREFETEQLAAFEEQVQWSVETHLPLMIHCRKAQNEMVKILRRYNDDLPGGVFHCFTGNEIEAQELLQFPNFVLGIGGVSTFKKSPLAEMLATNVPLNRIVLETDCPYMAPVPHRGKRNEPAFVRLVAEKLAQSYHVTLEEINRQTNENVKRIFNISL